APPTRSHLSAPGPPDAQRASQGLQSASQVQVHSPIPAVDLDSSGLSPEYPGLAGFMEDPRWRCEWSRQSMTIDPDKIYIVAEVAAILRCGKSNVYDLLYTGELACIPVGAGRKGRRVMGRDLLAFLDSRREGGPQQPATFKHISRWMD